MDLSVVIPSANRPDLLHACLASVVRHAPPRTEVIVVDDGSPDGSVRQMAERFAGVQTVRLGRRRGFCVAANAGIWASRGTVVELLNDDTEVTAGWASAALANFADRSVAAVAPLVLQGPPTGGPPRIDSAGDRYYLGGVAGKRGHGEVLPAGLTRCAVFGASGSSAFYRRDVLLRVGALPETFGAYFEDVDLAFRLHRAGYGVVFEPESRVFHRGAASHGKKARRLLEQQSRNEERVFWRNLPGPMLTRALPRHLAVLAGKAWLRWQAGELAPFLFGRMRVISEWSALRRHRRWLRNLDATADVSGWELEERYWGKRGVAGKKNSGQALV